MGDAANYRDTVASPRDSQVFDLATDECLSEPGTRTPGWPVRVVDDHVEIGEAPLPAGVVP